jgi:heme/copper-type cytochrome/quinol oxidase subunit 2
MWKCKDNLPPQVGLGITNVSCEGCVDSSDKLKIIGSCYIFYQLVDKLNKPSLSNASSYTNTNTNNNTNKISVFEILIFFFVVVLILICVIIIFFADSRTSSSNQTYIPVISNKPIEMSKTILPTINSSQNNVHPSLNHTCNSTPTYQSIPIYQSIPAYKSILAYKSIPTYKSKTRSLTNPKIQTSQSIYPQTQVKMTNTTNFYMDI